MSVTTHIIYMDDWVRVTINGDVVWDNHSLPAKELIELLGLEEVMQLYQHRVKEDWQEEHNGEVPDPYEQPEAFET